MPSSPGLIKMFVMNLAQFTLDFPQLVLKKELLCVKRNKFVHPEFPRIVFGQEHLVHPDDISAFVKFQGEDFLP